MAHHLPVINKDSLSFSPPSLGDDALDNNYERSSATDLNEGPLKNKECDNLVSIDGVSEQLPTNPEAKTFAVEEGELKQRAKGKSSAGNTMELSPQKGGEWCVKRVRFAIEDSDTKRTGEANMYTLTTLFHL